MTQTRHSKGYVYVVSNPAWPGWFKVGCSQKMRRRLGNYQTGSPFRDYRLHHSRYFDDMDAAESGAHDQLRKLSAEHNGEWFKVDLSTAVRVVERLY